MALPFTQRATNALYAHSKGLADNISKRVAIVGVLGASGRIQIIEGGQGWNERILYGESTNADHRSWRAPVTIDDPQYKTMAQYNGAYFSDSVVINHVERDEAKGEWGLGNVVEEAWQRFNVTAVSQIGAALMASTQATDYDPIPLPVYLPATLPASQTGTDRGGINSAQNSWWRSYAYTTTIADLGAAAGLRLVQAGMLACARGGATKLKPDFALTTDALFTRFTSTAEANRRWTSDAKIASLGYSNVTFDGMTVVSDTNCPATRFFMINTNTLRIKALRQPNMKNIMDDTNQYSLPMVINPFVRDTVSFNDIALCGLKYQLTCNDLGSNGILSDCTE